MNRRSGAERAQRTRRVAVGPNVYIRRADIADCNTIAELLHAAFAEFKTLYTEGGFAATILDEERIAARMRQGPVWVALHDSVIVGTVAAVKKGESVYLRGMAVLPSVRGSGAGARLLEHVEKWAASENMSSMCLSTTPFLDSAIRLYLKFGFQRTVQGPHDLFGTALFTMAKEIGK